MDKLVGASQFVVLHGMFRKICRLFVEFLDFFSVIFFLEFLESLDFFFL